MKLLLLILVVIVFAETKPAVTPVKDKVLVESVTTIDTSKIVLSDTLLAIRHNTVKVVKTLKDTVKLVKADTTKIVKIDTLWTKKYSRGSK
jgi:hypothetical protein